MPAPDKPRHRSGYKREETEQVISIALLDDQRYTEISRRLRQEDFKPDVNDKGNPTPQLRGWRR
jgi:hypothetical protein